MTILQARAAVLAGSISLALFAPAAGAQGGTPTNDAAAPFGITSHPLLSLNQSTVWAYANLDASIGTYSGVPDGAGGTHWQAGSLVAALNPDKWGFLAQHTLDADSGLKVMGNIEGEFETPTGNEDTPGTIFNRQAWVGFKSDALGQLLFGRSNPVAKDFDGIWADPYHENSQLGYGGGGYTNSDNFKYIVWYIGVATGTHADSNVQYKRVMGPWVLGLDYQFGGNQRLDGQASGFGRSNTTNSGAQVALAYNGSDYHVSGHYSHVNRDDKILQAFTLGGGWQPTSLVQVNGGLIHYAADQAAIGRRTDDAFTLSGKLAPAGHMTYELGYVNVRFHNAAANDDGAVMIPFLQSPADAEATLANGGHSGRMQTLYGGARYHYDRDTQLYLMIDRMEIGGGIKMNGWYNGQFGGAGNPKGQTEVLAGVDYRF
jgi:predicted porin